MAGEQWSHHELGEEPLAGRLQHLPARPEPQRLRLPEDEPHHEAEAAHLVQELVPRDERRQRHGEGRPVPGAPVPRCLSSSITCRVARPATIASWFRPKVVEWTTARSIIRVHPVEDRGAEQRRPHRDVAAGESLRDGDHVGLEPAVLVRPHLPRPARVPSGPRRPRRASRAGGRAPPRLVQYSGEAR